jgi:hypothetical protein
MDLDCSLTGSEGANQSASVKFMADAKDAEVEKEIEIMIASELLP